MAVPASKIKQLCTTSEIALIRASRKGELDRLTHAEVKKLAVQARKLFDKWQGLGRGQARDRGRQEGFGEKDANTKLKVQLFREALDGFNAQLEKLAGAAAKNATVKVAKPVTKKKRSAEHRATRAAVRKGMTAVEDLLNTKSAKSKKAVKKTVKKGATEPAVAKQPLSAVSTPSTEPAAKPAVGGGAAPPVTAKTSAKKPAPKSVAVSKSAKRQAVTAAKQARVVSSGKTTRLRGHVSASGKRSQARRDAKG